MFLTLFGTVVIAGIIGYASEKTGWTQNGYIQSIIICVGGAFLFYFIRIMFGFGFASPGVNAIVSSIGALIIVPFSLAALTVPSPRGATGEGFPPSHSRGF